MKSISTIIKIAESFYPEDSENRDIKIQSFVDGFMSGGYTIDDMRKSFDSGKSLDQFHFFEDFIRKYE